MRYVHTVERSIEILREALPLMSKQPTALHPVNYAVWYAYVANDPPQVRKTIDGRLAEHGEIDDAATQAIYDEHLGAFDTAQAQHIAEAFRSVISGMSDSATAASKDTTLFGESLTRISAGTLDAHALGELRDHTSRMQHSVAHLLQRLEASRREIDALRDEVARARREALIDALTGLANRRAFDQRLAALLAVADADPQARQPCLVISDIDHFKRINDRYGHQFGDRVLKGLADLIRMVTPEAGLAARVGGEEFALLLPDALLAEAEGLAEKLRATIAGSRIHLHREGGSANDEFEQVTVSLGVAPYRRGESANDFFERADLALYRAKAAGRNQVSSAA